MTYPDPLEAAFLRLRHAADADEYVPMERVIDTVLARLAALRVENERLRAALVEIASGDYSDPFCKRTPEQRARDALAGK